MTDRHISLHAERSTRFAGRYATMKITSTAVAMVDIPDILYNVIPDILYNVKDSTDDPKIAGLKLKQLLIAISATSANCEITEACYADAFKADLDSSHAKFSIGGM